MRNHCRSKHKISFNWSMPKVFENFRVRKKVEKCHFSGEFGRFRVEKGGPFQHVTHCYIWAWLMNSQKRQKKYNNHSEEFR